MLPFNLAHLGMAAYGLWMLTTSFTVYFAMLDLGYGGALVRFVAQYRAQRNARALNEVLSTFSFVYAAIGVVAYLVVVVIAVNTGSRHQAHARSGLHEPAAPADHRRQRRPAFRVRGLRRRDRRLPALPPQQPHEHRHEPVVAAANVAVLLMGYGVVALVGVTTVVRSRPARVLRQRLSNVPRVVDPVGAFPARAFSRGQRFQRLHAAARCRVQGELFDRHARRWRTSWGRRPLPCGRRRSG